MIKRRALICTRASSSVRFAKSRKAFFTFGGESQGEFRAESVCAEEGGAQHHPLSTKESEQQRKSVKRRLEVALILVTFPIGVCGRKNARRGVV
jgi:hypothetical protein